MLVEYVLLVVGGLAILLALVYPLIVAVARQEIANSKPLGVLQLVDPTPEEVKALALEVGFKLKVQPDGREDLNPYVYEFAYRMLSLSADRAFDSKTKEDQYSTPVKGCRCQKCCYRRWAKRDNAEGMPSIPLPVPPQK